MQGNKKIIKLSICVRCKKLVGIEVLDNDCPVGAVFCTECIESVPPEILKKLKISQSFLKYQTDFSLI